MADPIIEDVDYYLENGAFVFTEAYHRKRGYCCGNACRHCPYNWINVPSNSRKLLSKSKSNKTSQEVSQSKND